MTLLKIRLGQACEYLGNARNEWRAQLDQYEGQEDGVIDKGIEVLTHINQAIAKLGEIAMLNKNEIRERFGKKQWEMFVHIMERKLSEAIEEMEDELHDQVSGQCPEEVRDDIWLWNVWDLIFEDTLETWGFFSN